MNNTPLFKDKLRKNLLNEVYWCCLCGYNKLDLNKQEKRNLLVHHIFNRNGFPDLVNIRKNLVVICTACHSRTHGTSYDFGCYKIIPSKNSDGNVFDRYFSHNWRIHKPCFEYFYETKKIKRKLKIKELINSKNDNEKLAQLICEELFDLYGERTVINNDMLVAMEIKKIIGGDFIFGRRFTNKTDKYYVNSIECVWIRSEGSDYDPLHKNFWRNQKEECHPCDKYRIGINLLKHYVDTFHWELDKELRSLLLDTKIEEILEQNSHQVRKCELLDMIN